VNGPGPTVEVWIDDERMELPEGQSIAAALWARGRRTLSAHPLTGRPRGPLCGMGICQECEIRVRSPDDPSSRPTRACQEPAAAGLRVEIEAGIGTDQ
jgi:hypothetical protein